MKERLNKLVAFVTVLALVTLACQAVTGLLPGGEGAAEPEAEPTVAPLDEAEAPTEEAPSGEGEAPESQTEETQLGDVYTSKEGGFSFQTIPGYEVEEFMGFVNTRSPDDEEVALMLVGSLLEESSDLESLYQNALEEAEQDGEDVEFTNRRDVTVNGIPGIAVDVSGPYEGKDMLGRMVIVAVSPTQEFRMIGIAPADRWEAELEPLFEATLATVQLFEAEPSEMDFEEETEEEAEAPQVEEVRQWATSATASSEYSSQGWAAMQATGEPDTIVTECEDAVTAWASSGSDTVEWLELGFDTPVVPTEINIIQTHAPDQVVQVEVIDTGGAYHTVYTGEPENLWELCPYTLTVFVDGIDFVVDGVKITIDQSVIETSWNELDAVELVGFTGAETVAAPADEVDEEETAVEGETSEGAVWRVGGERGTEDGQVGFMDGVDVGPDGYVYVTDANVGVSIYAAADGSPVASIAHADLLGPTDVQVGPDGTVYVTDDWSNDKVFVFSSAGELIAKFGEAGNGPGQFGTFSPYSLAVSPDGEIYVLDENETDAEESFTRVQVFSAEGTYLREFSLDDEYSDTEGMDFGPDGNLYVVDWSDSLILKVAPDGVLLGSLGDEALSGVSPVDIAIDQAGNFYIGLDWSQNCVMKLDSSGNMIAQFGTRTEDNDKPWPEGMCDSVNGIAVTPDGSRVFVSDWSNDYAYITAFEFK